MIIAKVVGTVIATRKNTNLVGSKFLVVEEIESENRFVAIDNVGAGIGETVLIVQGSAARIGCGLEKSPIDAAIVGIIDEGSRLEQ